MPDRFKVGDYYRIQHLPLGLTQEDLREQLHGTCPYHQHWEVEILSLSADDKTDDALKVAIISFVESESQHIDPSLQAAHCWCRDASPLQLDREFRGLTPVRSPQLDRQPSVDLDIIIVHGLGGHPLKSFLYQKDGCKYFWPVERLSTAMPTVQVWLYGYCSRILNSTSVQDLDSLACKFGDALRSGTTFSSRRRPCVLVGVSLGGLIIKRAITLINDEKVGREVERKIALKRIAHLIMIGVPNQGMRTDNLESLVEGQANKYLIYSLSRSSSALKQLCTDFAKAYPFKDSKVYSFYETKQTTGLRNDNGKLVPTDGDSVLLVDQASATHNRWQNESDAGYVRPIDKDHRNIAKFKRSEESLGSVMFVLDECQKSASIIVQKRLATTQICQIMCNIKIPRTSRQYVTPFRMLTLDLLNWFREIYKALPGDQHGAVEYDTIAGIFPNLNQKPFSCTADELKRIWTQIKPITSSLDRNLVLAFLFLIYLDSISMRIPEFEFETSTAISETARFTKPRYRVLKRFDDWTPCQCSAKCSREWNFANDAGLSQLKVNKSGTLATTSCSHREKPMPSSEDSASPCPFEKYLKDVEKGKTRPTRQGEKLFKKTSKAWFAVRRSRGSGGSPHRNNF